MPQAVSHQPLTHMKCYKQPSEKYFTETKYTQVIFKIQTWKNFHGKERTVWKVKCKQNGWKCCVGLRVHSSRHTSHSPWFVQNLDLSYENSQHNLSDLYIWRNFAKFLLRTVLKQNWLNKCHDLWLKVHDDQHFFQKDGLWVSGTIWNWNSSCDNENLHSFHIQRNPDKFELSRASRYFLSATMGLCNTNSSLKNKLLKTPWEVAKWGMNGSPW
jgi:hypothetical protein